MPPFREVTNTQGVNYYDDVQYASYCNEDGFMVAWSAEYDSIGFGSALDTSWLTPNAPFLRVAESIDAVESAIKSANAETKVEAAGYLVCTVVRLYPFEHLNLRTCI
jgi:hypothetical protein